MILLLGSALTWLLAAPAQQSPASKTLVRPCADSWNDPGVNAKKNRPKRSKKEAHPETGACTELAFSALEIQEYLQSHARDAQWQITGDLTTEDSWTFSLGLGKEELLRDTTDDSKKKRVEWTAGTVRVHVNTARLPDGYTRTIIRASFRGYGRSADQFAMQKEYWDLESNDNFENSMVSDIQRHFGVASAEGIPHTQSRPEIPAPYLNGTPRNMRPSF